MAKEVRLAASYGELSEFLQQCIKLVMEFLLALGGPVDASTKEALQTKASPNVAEAPEASVDDDMSIFGMRCVKRLRPDSQSLVGEPFCALVDVLFTP